MSEKRAKQLEDYTTVGERIQQFYDRFPQGNLETWREPKLFQVGERTFIAYAAAAYRDGDDEHPGIGWAWEPVPGPTTFTRDSELQNAETAAWGRAIASLGFETHKGLASREEVQARGQDKGWTKQTKGAIFKTLEEIADRFPPPENVDDWIDATRLVVRQTWGLASLGDLSEGQATELLQRLKAKQAELVEQAEAEEFWPEEPPQDQIQTEDPVGSSFEAPVGKRGEGA